jgi:hypothetical protein
MLKYLLILILLFTFSFSKAQNPLQISVSNTTLAATDSVQPLWFVANQHGKIQSKNSFLNISELIIGQSYKNRAKSKLGYTWGADLIAAFGNSNYYQTNRAFAGVALNGWELKGGMFYDDVKYAGLSTSNGNIARSENARPVPKIGFSTLGYKPVPFLQNSLSFKAEYDEGFLNDERYVDGAHLHHKSLYFKIHTASTWNFEIGFEHYVMWGGTSSNPNIGELPESWNAYWHYVFALPGGDDFPQTDKKNISGNQLGTYQLKFEKYLPNMKINLYISHPWEDNSGLNLHNWPDNLLGIHFDLNNKKALVTDILYEFNNTRQQSIKDSVYYWDENSDKWKIKEYDNYYNHSIYRSGFTYQQQVMSSPLFFPVNKSNDISTGIQSNRFFSHHIGAKGNITESIKWKGLLTYIQHLGTYSKPYTQNQKQISGLLEVQYIDPDFPVELSISSAADANNITGNNLGIRFSVVKKIN